MLRQYHIKNYDFKLILLVIALTVIGIATIGSANSEFQDKQIMGLFMGLFSKRKANENQAEQDRVREVFSGVQENDPVYLSIYSHIYTHVFFSRFFSIIGYYKILNIVLCAIQ